MLFAVASRRVTLLAALLMGNPLLAVAETATPEQRAVLSAICARSDVVGLNCKRARGYPERKACNVELTGVIYNLSIDGAHASVAPYTSDCEPHATNYGGSVILVEKDQVLKLNSYAVGISLAPDCQVARSTDGDSIYCIVGFEAQGIMDSRLDAYHLESVSADKYALQSAKTIASAEDQTGFSNYLSVTCDHHVDFFNLSDLAAGPAPGTVAVNVVYADTAIIKAACAPGRPDPKDALMPALPGHAHIASDAAKKARYIYDTQSGEFTTLERFNETAGAAPTRPQLGAGALASVTEKRIALVIGNSLYQKAPPLPNPASDAGAVADRLRKLGFVDVKLIENADENALLRALGAFAGEAVNADRAVVYFAGHGIVVDGRNYLVPTDATLATDKQVAFEAVSLDQVMNATSGARNLRLVILDACRDNPFARKMVVAGGSRSLSRGLAPVESNAGTMVVYAARDGGVAKDGDGSHSPFTEALLKYLGEPNLELSLLFRKVRDDVLRATDNNQEPNSYGSLPGAEFYFARTASP